MSNSKEVTMYKNTYQSAYNWDQKQTHPFILDYSFFLMDLYVKEKKEANEETGIKNVKKLQEPFSNLLALILNQYRFGNYLIRKKVTKPVSVFISLHSVDYSKTIHQNHFDDNKAALYENIKTFNLTYRSTNHIVEIFEYFNMITVTRGSRNVATKIYCKPLKEWKQSLFYDLDKNLTLYFLIISNYLYFWRKPESITKKKKKIPSAVINTNVDGRDKYIPASQDSIKEMDRLNMLIPEKYRSFYNYRRTFKDDETCGGRLYSKITFMPKVYRKLLLESAGYVEIDYPSFVPNVLSLISTQEQFPERAYNLVAKAILKKKKKYRKISDNEIMKPLIHLIGSSIKKAVLICLNIKNLDKYSKLLVSEARSILINAGLYYSKEDFFEAWQYVSQLRIKDKNERHKHISRYLLGLMKERWDSDATNTEEFPYVFIRPKNLIDGIRCIKSLNVFSYTTNWQLTQLIESELLLSLYDKLVEDKIIPIFIHDALYVPNQHKDKYIKIVESNLYEIVDNIRSILTSIDTLDEFKDQYTKLYTKIVKYEKYENLHTKSNRQIRSIITKIDKDYKNEFMELNSKTQYVVHYSNLLKDKKLYEFKRDIFYKIIDR